MNAIIPLPPHPRCLRPQWFVRIVQDAEGYIHVTLLRDFKEQFRQSFHDFEVTSARAAADAIASLHGLQVLDQLPASTQAPF